MYVPKHNSSAFAQYGAMIPEPMAFNITSSADSAQCFVCFGFDVTALGAYRYVLNLEPRTTRMLKNMLLTLLVETVIYFQK